MLKTIPLGALAQGQEFASAQLLRLAVSDGLRVRGLGKRRKLLSFLVGLPFKGFRAAFRGEEAVARAAATRSARPAAPAVDTRDGPGGCQRFAAL